MTYTLSGFKYFIDKYVLSPISDKLILKPEPIDHQKYNKWLSDPFAINEKIHTLDGEILDAMFYNANKVPTYDDDTIYMYSHGNSGWVGPVLESTTVHYLARRGSVFVYDYRGYGKSTGKVSSTGCLRDAISIYAFLVEVKKVKPTKIILFGHSLGACVTTYLMHHLVMENIKNNVPTTHNNISKIMIIQNAFENIHRVCNDMVPFVGKYVVSDMNTDRYIKSIDDNHTDIIICIIHSKDDELIHHNHSVALSKHIKNNVTYFVSVNGTHDNPQHNETIDEFLVKINRKGKTS